MKLYQGIIDKTYVDALKKLTFPKSTTNWKDAIKVLTRNTKKTTNQKKVKDNNAQQELDLFEYDKRYISPNISKNYPAETKFILSLDCLKNLPDKAIERLIDTFGYSAKEKNKEEHLKYFTSICINEGRGYKTNGEKRKRDKAIREAKTEAQKLVYPYKAILSDICHKDNLNGELFDWGHLESDLQDVYRILTDLSNKNA